MPIPEIVSIAKAKAHLSELAQEAKHGKVFEIISHSEPMAIVLGVERYEALLETLEDLEDGLSVVRGRLEDYEKAYGPYREAMAHYWAQHPEEAPVPFEEFKAKYLAKHPDAAGA